MSISQDILDGHLCEINRLSTIKTSNLDFNKMIKNAKEIHSKAYKSFNLANSETKLVKASRQSIKAWDHSRLIDEYLKHHHDI
jgi:uncharacterized membrane protein YgaE (UPF0421/DUF939 family)